MTELLAPAGSFECFKQALYNGADAIYLATERFGARAYAKNLTLDELKEALILAHSLNKKIYVTVNTILKEDEILDCKKYINTLYELGVDGLILADFSMINYVINNCKGMEAHISTQDGIKDLYDVRFFENLGVDRCVLARENSIDEIKYIKQNSKMPLEVFSYGALCVSYSGGCLMSSLLTLRSGNRGRCSQNCRREYRIFKDDKMLADYGFHLSMRDLNTTDHFKELKALGIDSLKLEGRMKSPEYVKTITSDLRLKLDDDSYKPKYIDTVFHRNYTEGFIFNEDKGMIVDPSKRSSEGAFIGKTIEINKGLTKIKLIRDLNINDRIRIENDNDDYYFTIDKIYDLNHKEVKSSNSYCYLNIYKEFKNANIYKMTDSSIDLTITNKYKKKIIIDAFGSYNTPLTLKTNIDGKIFTSKSDMLFDYAKTKGIDDEVLFKQLSKLNETSFYLDKINNYLEDNLFMTVSAINDTRRKLINEINDYYQNKRTFKLNNNTSTITHEFDNEIEIVAKCQTIEQYEALKSLGINKIYFDNYIPYVEAKYKDINEDYILAGNYGALYYYKNKDITCDYSFNAINSEAIYNLLNNNAKYVCLSLEADSSLIKDITTSFNKKYGYMPPLEIVAYGRQNLMTTKYCPLKRFKQCGICNNSNYYLADKVAKFPIYHTGCITHIINDKPLNLIDDLDYITKYVKKIRLDFTIESKDEVIKIVNEYKDKLNGSNKNYFDSKNNTRGYFKRPIL